MTLDGKRTRSFGTTDSVCKFCTNLCVVALWKGIERVVLYKSSNKWRAGPHSRVSVQGVSRNCYSRFRTVQPASTLQQRSSQRYLLPYVTQNLSHYHCPARSSLGFLPLTLASPQSTLVAVSQTSVLQPQLLIISFRQTPRQSLLVVPDFPSG